MHIQKENNYWRRLSIFCNLITISVSFSVAQYLKSDLMRQFDTQVNDFMDSLIEESTSLEPAPVPAVFSPPMSDKERSKLRYCSLLCYQMKSCIWRLVTADANALLLPTLVLKRRQLITVFFCRHFRPPHGEGKLFVSRRSLLE